MAVSREPPGRCGSANWVPLYLHCPLGEQICRTQEVPRAWEAKEEGQELKASLCHLV